MERMLATVCGCLVILLALAQPGGSTTVADSSDTTPTTPKTTVTSTTTAPTTVTTRTTTCNDRYDSPECPVSTKRTSTLPTPPKPPAVESTATIDDTDDEKATTVVIDDVTTLGADDAKATTGGADVTTGPLDVSLSTKNTVTEVEAEVSTTGVDITTEAEDSTTAPVVPQPVDPCTSFKQGNGTYYRVKMPSGTVDCFRDVTSPSESWVRFYLDNGTNAEIPTVAIKQEYCGVHFPYRVHLHKDGSDLPPAGATISADLCAPIKGDASDSCAHRKDISILNCGDEFYLYKFLEPLETKEICSNKGGAGICLKGAGEEISYEFLDDPPPTTAPTTVEPTTEEPEKFVLPRIQNLTEAEENGTITVEYKFPEDEDENNVTAYWAINKDKKFRQFIAKILNKCNAPVAKDTPSTPPVVTKALVEETTTTAEKTTKFFFTTARVRTVAKTDETSVATKPATTKSTTTKTTTPAQTESPFEIFTEEIDDSAKDALEGVTQKRPAGPVVGDNVDDDAGKGPGLRRRRSTCVEKFTMDDVFYVYDTPAVVRGILQVSFIVFEGDEDSTKSDSRRRKRAAADEEPRGRGVVSQDDLFNALNEVEEETHNEEVGLPYVKHYKGRPVEPDEEAPPPGAKTDDQKSIWDAHMGLFIAIIILIILCLIVVIIGILCIKCKGRRQNPEKTPLRSEEGHIPTAYQNPIPEEEITKGESVMMESQNPAYTPNGSGHHLTKGDEDNGWIVPYEELTYNERERPELDNTKL